VSSAEFEALSPGLPAHQDEVMAAHQGTPGVGQAAPEPDHGQDDRAKYDGTTSMPPLQVGWGGPA